MFRSIRTYFIALVVVILASLFVGVLIGESLPGRKSPALSNPRSEMTLQKQELEGIEHERTRTMYGKTFWGEEELSPMYRGWDKEDIWSAYHVSSITLYDFGEVSNYKPESSFVVYGNYENVSDVQSASDKYLEMAVKTINLDGKLYSLLRAISYFNTDEELASIDSDGKLRTVAHVTFSTNDQNEGAALLDVDGDAVPELVFSPWDFITKGEKAEPDDVGGTITFSPKPILYSEDRYQFENEKETTYIDVSKLRDEILGGAAIVLKLDWVNSKVTDWWILEGAFAKS